jgi:release factor glutamine methyltransferase
MKIEDLLADSTTLLNSDEATLEGQLLLQHLLNVNRAWLIAHQKDTLEANIHKAFRALINRRINGEPIAYILGYREFYGLKLKVTPDTLIPRPDTETLVEAALEKIEPDLPLNICDLGTACFPPALLLINYGVNIS